MPPEGRDEWEIHDGSRFDSTNPYDRPTLCRVSPEGDCHPLMDIQCDEATAELVVGRLNSFDALKAACKDARELYDQLAYGPLDGAAHFGPDWSPPTDADMLAVRGKLASALKLAGETS